MDEIFFPYSEKMLMARAESVAGYSILQLAEYLNKVIPKDLQRNKGWIGSLLEIFLGATGGSKAKQDFFHLGIELKTIPVNRYTQPLETTFVCVAPLVGNTGITWENSYLREKLKKVLWIPIEAEETIPLAERRIGRPILWSPDKHQEALLQNDWEELMEMITFGHIHQLTAYYGEVLQIRPKAAHSRVLTRAIGKDGESILALPRGFYLRKQFTQQLLKNYVAQLDIYN